MPSPPLSPTPRRWQSPDNPDTLSDFASMLESFERQSAEPRQHDSSTSATDQIGFPGWRGIDSSPQSISTPEAGYRTAPGSPDKPVPTIGTSSPTPKSLAPPTSSPAPSSASSEGRLSPLPTPPSRSQLFAETSTAGRMVGSGIRPPPSASRVPSLSPMQPQATGQSTATIDAAHQGVFSQLDALANQPSTSFQPAAPAPFSRTFGVSSGATNLARLDAVSERTEPMSGAPSLRGSSPASTHHGKSDSLSLARSFPLPPSPIKGSRPAGGSTPQSSPSKASDLIRMFESKGAQPPPPQPSFAPAMSRTTAMAAAASPSPPQSQSLRASPGIAPPTSDSPSPAAAPSSFRPQAEAPPATRPTPPPKATSPLSQVRTMIASWRARTKSPGPLQTDQSKQSEDPPRLLGRDRGWNVSIRRRRRNEGQDSAMPLAEKGEEPETEFPSLAESSSLPLEVPTDNTGGEHASHRTPSVRSVAHSSHSEGPRSLTGVPVRTGSLYYLNVHDLSMAPNFVWVQTDARLYNEGLQLVWRTPSGEQAVVVLDLEYCEEVASTYSPGHPLAGDDLGAAAARRQGQLAEDLYPFKLVYDDGTERLGCDSARDRVRWVNAIWTVLERTRAVASSQRAPSHHSFSRPASMISAGDGSSSTHYAPRPVVEPSSSTALSTGPFTVMPLMTTDDAVITTSAGFVAPIVQRGSRRLAAGSLERGRSLRRVASEADLSEAAGPSDEYRSSDPDLSSIPLTVDVARAARTSRDFRFAGGALPPPLASPPAYTSPVEAYGSATSNLASSYGTPQPASSSLPSSTPAATAQQFSTPQSAYPARPTGTASTVPSGSTGTMYTARTSQTITPAQTAQGWSTTGSFYTPPQSGPSAYGTAFSHDRERTAIPAVSVTGASPSSEIDQTTGMQTVNEAFSSMMSVPGTVFDTAPGTAYTTAAGSLGSPFETPADRSDRTSRHSRSSSYDTAPPPVPSRDSRYGTPSLAPSSGQSTPSSEPIRYQLRDEPVRNLHSTSDQESNRGASYPSSRADSQGLPTPRPQTVYTTATTKSQSEYSTVPPPPISRSATNSDRLSFASDVQERAETATHVSEPDTDLGLIADLERQSSAGSDAPRPLGGKRTVPGRGSRYDTAPAWNSGISGVTPYGTAGQSTVYGTAKESMYATAPSWHTQSTNMMTAGGTQESYKTAANIPTEPPKPSSISTASTVPSSRIRRVPVPSLPPPTPSSSGPSSAVPSSDTTSSNSTYTGPNVGVRAADLQRILNWLMGQDQARQGQNNRIESQLDRIEGNVKNLTELMPVRDRPPPLPSKHSDDDGSTPSSPSSFASTARPITPPPLSQDAIARQFDDMRNMLGTLIGRTNDIADEVARKREYDVELEPRPELARIENLLRRTLYKLGDTDFDDWTTESYSSRRSRGHPPSSTKTATGSMYNGSNAMYSDELEPKIRVPANSFMEHHDPKHKRWSSVPSSLLDGPLPDIEFEEEFHLANLPPDSPAPEHQLDPVTVPPHIAARLQRQGGPVQEQYEQYDEYTPSISVQEPSPESLTTPLPPSPVKEPEPRDEAPIAYREEPVQEDQGSIWSEDDYDRDRARRLPPPQPVDLPTPVNSPRNVPMSGPAFRPGLMPGPGMPPPPPPVAEVPRPSMPRIAGVRDPISTTYFRRGFPPPGPMGPMGMPGMFPGPMGIPGPGMGPLMPGLRPGLNGFGGPIGPNVNPSLRRPGFFPPGVSSTGEYGLPAAAHYGRNGNYGGQGYTGTGRPPATMPPDDGIGDTTSSDTTATPMTTEQLLTPMSDPGHTAMPPPTIVHTPATDSDDSFRRTLENAQALAHAQGDQQNEMSRYLHGMSDQIADARRGQQQEFADILADINRLRSELRPKHVTAQVLPDGQVVLSNGDIVEGIRGVPVPGAPPAVTPPTAAHVKARVLPDGTVMVGDKIVDGIRGAPTAPAPDDKVPETVKDVEQDRKLASLADKVAELMNRSGPTAETTAAADGHTSNLAPPQPTELRPGTDVTREKTFIKEREVINAGPGGNHREREAEEEIERDMVTDPSVPNAPTFTAADVPLPASKASSTGRINPRTGKPIVLPAPLGLQPRDPSPIVPLTQAATGPQLISEEHEEVIHNPPGVTPAHTHTTTRTYRQPDGTLHTEVVENQGATRGQAASGPRTAYGDPVDVAPFQHPLSAMPNVAPTHAPTAHEPTVAANVPLPPSIAPAKSKRDEVWETNRARPQVTTLGNMPTKTAAAPSAAPTAAAPTAHTVGPDHSRGNQPPMPVFTDAADASRLPPSAVGAPAALAPADPSGGKSGKGLRWDSHLPGKDVTSPPSKTQPKATELSNVPNVPPPGGASGAAPAATGPPPGGMANIPSGSGSGPAGAAEGAPAGGAPAGGAPGALGNMGTAGSGAPGPRAPPAGAATAADGSKATMPGGDRPVFDTNHPMEPRPKSPGLLSKLKPNTTQPTTVSNVPVVPEKDPSLTGQPVQVGGTGKDTRFSDTAFVAPGAGHAADEHIASGGDTRSGTPNKLKKNQPGQAQVDPSGMPAASSIHNVPGFPESTGATGSAAPGSGSRAPAPEVAVLEEVVLPDGTHAYVRKLPPGGPQPPSKPAKSDKGKAADMPDGGAGGPGGSGEPPAPPAASDAGKAHCVMCCPTAPRDASGRPLFPCAHQDGLSGPSAMDRAQAAAAPSKKAASSVHPAEPVAMPPALAEEAVLGDGVSVHSDKATPGKLKKGKTVSNVGLSPEEEAMEDARKLAAKQKAAAESAAAEAAEKERILKAKEEKLKLAEERYKNQIDALNNLQRVLDGLANDHKMANAANDERVKASDKRRGDKTARDKKIQDALDKLLAEREDAKKQKVADDKKPGTQAILDALKNQGDGQAQFLRKLAAEIMEQNSNQHGLTQKAAQSAAREQVGFNLAGYLDDFSKALSGEVRVLLKEVGDLRESRRALYMEIADLLLMKGRQSAGDLMAILPYPIAPPKNPQQKQLQEKKASLGQRIRSDGQDQGGKQQQQQGQKGPGGVPAWSTFVPGMPPMIGNPPNIGGPARPLPQPAGGPPQPTLFNLAGGAVPPPPPPPQTRPMPVV